MEIFKSQSFVCPKLNKKQFRSLSEEEFKSSRAKALKHIESQLGEKLNKAKIVEATDGVYKYFYAYIL